MEVSTVFNNQVTLTELPENVRGRHAINYFSGEKIEPLFYVEGQGGKWRALPNRSIYFRSAENQKTERTITIEDDVFAIVQNQMQKGIIMVEETSPEIMTFTKYKIPKNGKITIGRGNDNDIQYEFKYMDVHHGKINYDNQGGIVFTEIGDQGKGTHNGSYINLKKRSQERMSFGDIFYFMGLKVVVTKDYIAVNNPNNLVSINLEPIKEEELSVETRGSKRESEFSLSPRLYKKNKPKKVDVTAPPIQREEKRAPWLFMYGPSIAMGLASLATSFYSINNIMQNNGDITQAIPSLLIALSMLFGTIICPWLAQSWEKRTYRVAQKVAQEEYAQDLRELDSEIDKHRAEQMSIILENNPTLNALLDRVGQKKVNLWERNIRHDDFLSLAVGQGDVPQEVEINMPDISKDVIEGTKNDLNVFLNKDRTMRNVPIDVNLADHSFLGVLGEREQVIDLAKALILEMIAQHSYDDLKLVFIYDEKEKGIWEFSKWLPHSWSNNMDENYIATNFDQLKELSNRLVNVIETREKLNDSEIAYEVPHYVIIACDRRLAEKAQMIKRLYSLHKNIRISVLALYDEKKYLPRSFDNYIEIIGSRAQLIDLANTDENQTDLNTVYQLPGNLNELAIDLANIKLDVVAAETNLPESFTLLDMFGIVQPEEFDAQSHWDENDATKTLAAQLGVDSDGYPVILDIHEKAHGPHGLIAGMTGSGKSELIISYIVSLAMNFSPDDVSFILVDFKGGGMGDTFKNLPHVVGSVTNLDGNELSRSLLAIESELVRRQEVLKETSEKYDISNIDIYRYQSIRNQLKEEGKKEELEPLPHLIIIVDEFAELKQQNQDFLDQLIRIARIGRSLGVHMILATQKPEGVVNDQITSNIRFKVCLKVQSAGDSKSMIGKADAAALKRSGQFYLQVGYDEIYELGQAAWAGAPFYQEGNDLTQNFKIRVFDGDNNELEELDTDSLRSKDSKVTKQVDEVVDYLVEVANRAGYHSKKLWIPPLEPPVIAQSNENEEIDTNRLSFRIGDYDDVVNQEYKPLRIDFKNEGNAIVYGSAGSGKLEVLNRMIYESVNMNTPSELELNIFDFGSGSLSAFAGAPHVKKLLFSYDAEEAGKLLEDIKAEIESRKRRFVQYGGDFWQFNELSGEQAPAIINIINNYANFSSIMDNYTQLIEEISREGTKYGVYVILSAENSNSVSYRLSPNFKQILALQQNNEEEFFNILGRHDNMVPSAYLGRGLFKQNNKTYEFQTDVLFGDQPNRYTAISEFCSTLEGGQEAPQLGGSTSTRVDRSLSAFSEKLLDYEGENWPVGWKDDEILEQTNPGGYVPIIYKEGFSQRDLDFVLGQVQLADPLMTKIQKSFLDDISNEEFYSPYVSEITDLIIERNKAAFAAQQAGQPLPEFEPTGYLIPDYMEFLTNLSKDDYNKWQMYLKYLQPPLNISLVTSIESERSNTLTDLIHGGVEKVNAIWLGNSFEGFDWYERLSEEEKNQLKPTSIIVQKDSQVEFGEVPII